MKFYQTILVVYVVRFNFFFPVCWVFVLCHFDWIIEVTTFLIGHAPEFVSATLLVFYMFQFYSDKMGNFMRLLQLQVDFLFWRKI